MEKKRMTTLIQTNVEFLEVLAENSSGQSKTSFFYKTATEANILPCSSEYCDETFYLELHFSVPI
jgi:hypothetical protein